MMPHNAKDEKCPCVICLNVDLPIKFRNTRSAKNDSWIRCDCCKSWFHACCGGFTPSQYTKINKENLWLKCVVCCFQQLQQFQQPTDCSDDSTSLTNLVLSAAKNRSLPSASFSGKANRNKKSSQVSTAVSTPVSSTASVTESNTSKTPQVSTSPVSCSTVYESHFSTQHLDCSSLTVPLGFNPESLPDLPDLDKIPSTNPVDQKPVIFNAESDTDKIIIIDNIDNASQFFSSRNILREVHNYFPDIKVEFAYSLAKGGVAIHASSKSDRDLLLYQLPAESFGGGVKHPPKCPTHEVVYIKGVNTSVDLHSFSEFLQKKDIFVNDIRRLTRRHTGKPTAVVRVHCSADSAKLLLNSKLVINNSHCSTERERSVRVIRCFKCQSFGHLARNCNNTIRCEFCAGSHGEQEQCLGNVKCVNCSSKHPSSSSKCPVYIARYENLAAQHTESGNISSVVVPSCI